MKKVLLLTLLTITSSAWAKNSERVLLQDAKTFSTEVSTATVRCSEVGYGSKELKINLAGLDGWTVLDHTNSNLGDVNEPCMTAGQCKRTASSPGFSIDDLVKNKPGSETITVSRILTEVKYEMKDENNQDVCQRSLREELSTSIRGIAFHHTREGLDQVFPIEVCRK